MANSLIPTDQVVPRMIAQGVEYFTKHHPEILPEEREQLAMLAICGLGASMFDVPMKMGR